jgi:hypothetical protein
MGQSSLSLNAVLVGTRQSDLLRLEKTGRNMRRNVHGEAPWVPVLSNWDVEISTG